MRQDYAPFIERVIKKYEGGYGWNRKDPGGPTKYGVTCYDLAEHRHEKMTSMRQWAPIVKAMKLLEAEDIYRHKYAEFLCFDRLPAGSDCVMLDYGINSGRARPVRVARALFKMKRSSVFTTELLTNIQHADPEWFINSMCEERLAFMHRIRNGTAWQEFGHGWQARVDDLNHYSIALHNKQPHIEFVEKHVKTPKASNADPELVSKVLTRTTAAGTAGGVGGGTAENIWHPEPWMIAAGIGVIVIAGVAYYFHQKHAQAAADAEVILPFNVKPRDGHVQEPVG